MRIERLDDTHHREAFRCGVPQLDIWLRDHALAAQRQDTARTFVLIDDTDQQLVGYYSLTMGNIAAAEAPRRLVRGLPRHPVPILLLARLAISETHQGRGLGVALLFEALHRSALAAEHAAARLIAVDPIGEAARRFYQRWGFQPVEGDRAGRMFVRTRDALASFPTDYGTK